MTREELESKHLAELHALAAKAGVPRYRLLRREELVEKLLAEKPAGSGRDGEGRRRDRAPRRRERVERERVPKAEAAPTAASEPGAAPAEGGKAERPRRRRRRRFGRRGKGLQAHDLLLPPPGRQALVYGESREACTALLRGLAAELAGASKGPDPIALLVDPGPEELADWKREVPGAELVAAGKDRHATDALAQAVRRVGEGEDVILFVDSLTRLEDPGTAKEIFDAGLGAVGDGSLTVVAALERGQ